MSVSTITSLILIAELISFDVFVLVATIDQICQQPGNPMKPLNRNKSCSTTSPVSASAPTPSTYQKLVESVGGNDAIIAENRRLRAKIEQLETQTRNSSNQKQVFAVNQRCCLDSFDWTTLLSCNDNERQLVLEYMLQRTLDYEKRGGVPPTMNDAVIAVRAQLQTVALCARNTSIANFSTGTNVRHEVPSSGAAQNNNVNNNANNNVNNNVDIGSVNACKTGGSLSKEELRALRVTKLATANSSASGSAEIGR